MNFLSHHYVARQVEPNATPCFFVGNLLPDLVVMSGGKRLRERHISACPDADLARGARLHFATDKRFHGHPTFGRLTSVVGQALRDAPFLVPPARTFFLAHVFVEIALDGVLIRRDPGLADDLYGQLATVKGNELAQACETMTGRPLPDLPGALARFTSARYLYQYASNEGLARSLDRIAVSAGLPGFSRQADQATLARVFAAQSGAIALGGPDLWMVE